MLASAILAALPAQAGILFADATADAEIDYLQHHANAIGDCLMFNGLGCEPERQTGGAAVGDADGDGRDDLLVTRMDASVILFQNRGDQPFGEPPFADITSSAGLAANTRSNGALWVDVDADGDLDLALGSVAGDRSYLYINDGSGHFTDESEQRGAMLPLSAFAGISTRYVGYSVAAGDYDGDGYPDLFFAFWLRKMSRLLHNRGAVKPGFFDDVTEQAGLAQNENSFLAFAPAFTDLDRDRRLDLAIAGDFGTSRLFWNNGDGVFLDGTAAAGVGTDENGMGSTFGDFDGDGRLDWFVTSIWDPEQTCETHENCNWGYSGNRLYRYNGNRQFIDATDASGVRAGWWGWGTVAFDADNDTDLDLVMTNGANYPFSIDILGQYDDDPMVLWENNGSGQMTDISQSAGITDTRSGKGLLTFDYDTDGDLDILVVNNAEHPVLYENNSTPGNDWLRVRFKAHDRAFEGLNAFVTVTVNEGGAAQVREMGVSSHFLGQSERVAHFGLGAHALTPIHQVRVEWPRNGGVQTFSDVARNQVLVIEAPAAESDLPVVTHHTADIDANGEVILSELLRVIQFFNSNGFHAEAGTEDGFAVGPGPRSGPNHFSDYNPANWRIELSELLRLIQFYNTPGGYIRQVAGEDGFAPAA